MVDDVSVAEARVTGTRHLLPFVQLDPGAFERLCFGLVSRRPGYHSVEHPGAAGRDHGCDIAALRDVDDGTERVYVQCKRIGRPPGPAMFKTEIDKVAGAVASGSLDRPDVLLFIVTQNISVEVRRDAVQHAKTVGLRAEFLALTELDAEVSRHADLVEQFFQLPGAVRGRSGGGSPFDWMTPRQLGAPWGTFVNRANELAELDRAVRSSASPQTPRVLVLSGPTGAGKSRLAEEWARSQAVNFPDGQLRLDLRRTRRSRTLANALRSSLEAFGCPAKSVPERLEDRQALFRSLTADRSVLLLLERAVVNGLGHGHREHDSAQAPCRCRERESAPHGRDRAADRLQEEPRRRPDRQQRVAAHETRTYDCGGVAGDRRGLFRPQLAIGDGVDQGGSDDDGASADAGGRDLRAATDPDVEQRRPKAGTAQQCRGWRQDVEFADARSSRALE